jgi:hypothetical protein
MVRDKCGTMRDDDEGRGTSVGRVWDGPDGIGIGAGRVRDSWRTSTRLMRGE